MEQWIEYTSQRPSGTDKLLLFYEPRKLVTLKSLEKPALLIEDWYDYLPMLVKFEECMVCAGRVDGVWIWGLLLTQEQRNLLPHDLILILDLRVLLAGALFGELPEGLVFRAWHLAQWDSATRFCPFCGGQLVWTKHESAKNCKGCDNVIYPRINPAIIVGILNQDQILLVRTSVQTGTWYSLVAGYVEAGEAIEDTVHREVYEETGIEIENLSYIGSQAWPFSGSLMLGFIAYYKSGDLSPDANEIADAGWFTIDSLPEVPPPPSLAHRIIKLMQAKLDLLRDGER